MKSRLRIFLVFLFTASMAWGAPSAAPGAQEEKKPFFDEFRNKALRAIAEKKFDEAEIAFAEAEKLASRIWEKNQLIFDRAFALNAQGKVNEAVKLLNAPVPPKQRSSFHEAQSAFLCGTFLEKAGRLEEASGYYRKALKSIPNTGIEGRSLQQLAIVARKNHNPAEAKKYYARMKALKTNITAYRALGYLGCAEIAKEAKNYPEALSELAQAEKLTELQVDNRAQLLLARAEIAGLQKQRKQQLEIYDQLLRLNGIDAVTRVKTLCLRARWALENRNYRWAFDIMKQAERLRDGRMAFDIQLFQTVKTELRKAEQEARKRAARQKAARAKAQKKNQKKK